MSTIQKGSTVYHIEPKWNSVREKVENVVHALEVVDETPRKWVARFVEDGRPRGDDYHFPKTGGDVRACRADGCSSTFPVYMTRTAVDAALLADAQARWTRDAAETLRSHVGACNDPEKLAQIAAILGAALPDMPKDGA